MPRSTTTVVEIKTATEIATMREAGRVVARALAACREAAQVGTSLLELDEVARTVLEEAGARSSFLNYRPRFAPTPFPGVICASVNDVVVHGIPDNYRLRDGDLLSVDFGAELDGFHGDAAISLIVGTGTSADETLIASAQEALAAGIAAALPGNRLGDIGHAIGTIGRRAGYGMPRDFGGHGIGRRMHEDPSVPNDGKPGRGFRLNPGLVLALEPMFMAGGQDEYRIGPDGWALSTIDGSQAAHVEHSVAITEDGPLVLTEL
ncbi:type I methionyl aminopeptidase [Actinopolymorpha sp. B9G3]|uniref:type I methionyl aminopeptidase n=1 Tax=Actinopolymorpha sp. B9G3 TaxID=3158970 RepID=UPI0032D91EF4